MAKADRLTKALESEGLSVWIDRKGVQSGNWKERVTEGLNHSRVVLMLLTRSSLDSSAVRRELAFAAKKNVPIIPIQLGEIPEDMLPDWFTLDYDELHRHMLDSKHYNDAVKKLASVIRTLRKTEQNPMAPARASV